MPGSVGRSEQDERPATLWWLCFAAAASTTPACDGFTDPSRDLAPALVSLAIDDLASSLRDGGLLYINAFPADTTFRLDAGERVPLAITVSSGDQESLRLYRVFCPPRERLAGFHCYSFILTMESGVQATSVAGQVAALGGRFHLVSVSGRIAGVTLFDPDDLVRRARNARSWPGVAMTELSFPFCAPGAPPPCGSKSALTAPMAVDTGGAVPMDGVLQVRPGDTLSVSYRQPDGSILVANGTIP